MPHLTSLRPLLLNSSAPYLLTFSSTSPPFLTSEKIKKCSCFLGRLPALVQIYFSLDNTLIVEQYKVAEIQLQIANW
jgi:hypothetical protein